ncbi:MAG: hypothetical protein ACD_31C00097G0001, partial [uncultured bacterium]
MLLLGEQIWGGLVNLGIFGLGFSVLIRNPKRKINRLFFLLTLSIGFLILFAFLSEVPRDLSISLILTRICLAFLPLFGVFLFLFSIVFPEEDKVPKFIKNTFVILATILFFLTAFTNLIIKNVEPVSWGFNVVYSNLFYLSLTFWLITTGLGCFYFLRHYRKITQIQKTQVKYLFLGLGIFVLISFLVNVPLRAMVGSDVYYRVGNYSAIFF